MIILYYKGYVNLEELTMLCKTTKNGTTAYNLINSAKEIGFESYGIKTNLEEINNDNIILPCIAHVTIENKYNHFIVIYEINFKKQFLIIADPIDKIKKLSFNEFKIIWNNVLIILYPLKKIPLNKNISLTNFITKLCSIYYKEIILLFFYSIIMILFTTIGSFYFKFMIDNSDNTKSMIIMIFILFIIIEMFKNITNYFRNKIIFILNEKIESQLITNGYEQIINLPYHYFKNHTTGDMVTRISDLEKVRDLINKVFITIFMDFPLTIISFIILFFINELLFFVILIMLFGYVTVLFLFKNKFNYYINLIIT